MLAFHSGHKITSRSHSALAAGRLCHRTQQETRMKWRRLVFSKLFKTTPAAQHLGAWKILKCLDHPHPWHCVPCRFLLCGMLETKLMVLVNALLHWHVMRNYLKQSTGRLHFIADRILESWIRTTYLILQISSGISRFLLFSLQGFSNDMCNRLLCLPCFETSNFGGSQKEEQRHSIETNCTNLSDLVTVQLQTLMIFLKKKNRLLEMDSEVGLIDFNRQGST